MKPKAALRHFLALAGSSLLAVSSASAQSTWNGSASNLWSGTNWDITPANGNALIFSGTNNQINTNDTALTNIGLLTLSNAGWNINLGTLTLNGGITASGTSNLSGILTLGAAQTWQNSTGLLTVTGTVANNSNLITVGGAGDTDIQSVISGTEGLTKNGAGILTLSAANSYSGATTIDVGTLKLGAAGDGTDSALGTIAAGTSVASGGALDLNGISLSTAEALSIIGTGVGSTGALTNSGAAASYSGEVTLGTGGATIGGSGDITLSAALAANANQLNKVGAGKLTLQAASTRTGGTVIDGGTLRIENATAFGTTEAAITINNGGTLELGTSTALAATTSSGTINLNNGGTILNGLAGTAARIDKTINLEASATGVFTFDSGSNASNVLTINGGANNRLAGGATGAQIQITGSGIVDVGETGQTRTTAVIADWYLQGGRLRMRTDTEIGAAANDFYFQGGTLLTDGAFTLGASRVLNFYHASGGTVDTTGGNLTLATAGQLVGANRLTKAGTNSLIISANNTGFSGGVTLNVGIVQVNSAQALGTSGNLTFTGGTLQYTANSAAGEDYSARIKNSSSAIILDSNSQTISLAGIIDSSNVGGLTKIGAGTMQLSGANTYNGTTTVTQGILSLDFTNGNNRIKSGNALTLNGGTLQFTNLGTNTQTFGTTTLILATASSITRSGTYTSGVSDLGTLSGSGTLDISNLTGSLSWIKASGNLSQTYLLNGLVTANSGASFVRTDASGNLFTVATSDFANNAIIGNNAGTSIRLVTGGSTGTGPTGSGFVGLSTVGTTDFDSILNRYTTGTVTIDVTNSGANPSNILRLGSYGPMSSSYGAALTIGTDVANGGVLTAGGADNTAGTIYVNGSNNTTINSAIQNNGTGVVGLNKDGSGTLTVAGANTYTGGTAVNAGTLQGTTSSASLTPQNPLGTGAITLNGSGTVLQLRASGTLNTTAETIQFNNNVTVGGNATINVDRPGLTSTTKTIQLGTLNIGANTLGITGANSYALRFNGATTLTGNATFNPTTANLTLAGAVGDGSADYSLTKTGAGTLILSGTNTFSGGVFINGGTLQIASAANLGDSANVVTFAGAGSLKFTSNTTLSQGFVINEGVTATLDAYGLDITINNSLSGSGTLWALNGGDPGRSFTFTSTNNTFSGNIQISSASGASYFAGLTMNSLADTPGSRIRLGNNNSTASFTYGAGAVAPLVLNNRQIEHNAGGAVLNNNATNVNSTVTVNTDLILSGNVGNRPFTLGGSNTGNNTFAGAITNGAGYVTSLTKAGAGNWIVSNDNTFTGSVSVSGGTLVLSGTNQYIGPTVLTGGTLQIASIADGDTASSMGKASSNPNNLRLVSGSPTLRYTGDGDSTNRNFALLGSATIDSSGTDALVFSQTGAISPDDSESANFATGQKVVTGLSSTANLAVGMRVTATGIAANSTIASIDSASQITLNNNTTAVGTGTTLSFGYPTARTLTLTGTNTAANTIAGVLQNSTAAGTGVLSLTKSGIGTWTLSGANTYTGLTTVSGGTLALSGSGTLGGGTAGLTMSGGSLNLGGLSRSVAAVSVTSAATSGDTIGNGSLTGTSYAASNTTGNAIISANLLVNATAGFAKSGAGAVTLTGTNTYTGTTDVTAGTLAGTQTSGTPFGTGAVTLGGGILSLAPTGSGSAVSVTGGTVAAGTLFTYNAGATLSLNRGSQNSLTYTFGGTGATTARGTNGTLILSTSNIANFGAAGTNLERFIMNGTAPTVVNTLVSGVVIQDRNTSNAGDFATYDATNGFTKASYNLTNTFTGSTNTSRVEITSATSTGSIASYAIKANATVTNTGTITLGSSGNPAALILNGGSINGGTLAAATGNPEFLIYTSGTSSISSAITSTNTGMSIFGPGSLELTSSNSFTGGLRVNNSTLIVSNDNQLGGANNALTLTGGTLQTSGASLAIGAGARAITLAAGQDQAGGTFNVSSGTTTYQNASSGTRIISGSGSLTKTGNGTLVLSGNTTNTYTGGTNVNVGILQIGANNMLADTGVVTVGGGTFDIQTFSDTVGAVTLTSGSITGSGGTLTGSSYAVQSGSVSAILGGTGALTKSTAGTVTLTGTNSYTGNTDVNAGTLKLQSAATTITQMLGGLRNQVADGTLNSDKSGAGNLTTTFSSYSRAAGATGNIVSTGGTNGTDNTVNITGAAGFIDAGLFYGGSEYAARNATNGYVRALVYGSDTSAAAVDTITASNHVKLTASPGSNQNSLTLLSLNLQGGGVNWTNNSGQTLTTPGILKSGGGSQSTISGGSVSGGTDTELVIRTDTSSDLLAISSDLTQGSGALTKSGAGTLTLSGTNTYTGQTHINAGTLSIGANVHLGAESTGATLNLKGGTLQATGTFGLFNGTAGTNNRAVTLLDQSSIEVTGTNTLTIAGVISNNASAGTVAPGFNKVGTGTLLLSGTNTYSGSTTVSGGSLALSGTGSIANSSTITINSSTSLNVTGLTGNFTVGASQSLGGSGTLTATGKTVIASGTLTPGNSPGTLTQDGGVLQLGVGGDLNWQVYDANAPAGIGGYDTVSLINGATLDLSALSAGNTYNINLWSLSAIGSDVNGNAIDFNNALNQAWTLFSTGTAISGFSANLFTINTGAFNGTSGFTNTLNGSFNVALGDSNTDLVLTYTAIPEPRAALLGGLGMLLLLRRRRR